MTPNTTRILKDVRPLMLPWCAVALAGAVPLVYPLAWTPVIYLVGFFVVPLLATLSLGDEFQHRTLALLLSQPVGRMKIWGEKLSVTVVAVVSAVLVFSFALRATSFHPGRLELAFAAAWIVAITASATFWTLFTRSTIGGMALNIGVNSLISFTIPWEHLADWLRARGYLAPGNVLVPSTVTLVVLSYAGVMVWLGGRMLARFQVTGGMAGDDLLIAGPTMMPGALAGWFRSRRSGMVLNLFRKEFRLLRPVWLISLLAAVIWACLTLFGLLFEHGFSKNFDTAVFGMGVASTLLIAILAGSMSLGEESTSGTHAWHLTLPVPVFLQWRIKLYMALFAGGVGAGILPMLVGRRLIDSSHIFVDFSLGTAWLIVVLLLTFAAFWCACAANGTVRAVMWAVPVVLILGLSNQFGEWAGRELTDLVITRFNLFADFKFTSAVASTFHNSEFLQFVVWGGGYYFQYITPMLVFILVPTILVAAFQSYRLFRAQLQGSTLSVIRHLWPLALLVFLCSFPLSAFSTFEFRAGDAFWRAEFEVLKAIEKIRPDASKLDEAHPLQLSVNNLSKGSPLSEQTRRWLGNSPVTVAPHKMPPGLTWWGGNLKSSPPAFFQDYLVTVHFAGGSDCSQRFWHVDYPKRDMRMLVVICK